MEARSETGAGNHMRGKNDGDLSKVRKGTIHLADSRLPKGMDLGASGDRGNVLDLFLGMARRTAEESGGKNMKDESIRKLTREECEKLSDVMGFGPNSLQDYEGRYTKIILKSPKTVRGITGLVFRNKD